MAGRRRCRSVESASRARIVAFSLIRNRSPAHCHSPRETFFGRLVSSDSIWFSADFIRSAFGRCLVSKHRRTTIIEKDTPASIREAAARCLTLPRVVLGLEFATHQAQEIAAAGGQRGALAGA